MKIKGWLSIGICASAMLFAAACSKGPEDVAIKVMEAIRDNEESVLDENCTSMAASMFKLQSAFASDAMLGMKFKVTASKINGDRAVVKIQAKMDGKTTDSAYPISLTKIDGEWKVSSW